MGSRRGRDRGKDMGERGCEGRERERMGGREEK